MVKRFGGFAMARLGVARSWLYDDAIERSRRQKMPATYSNLERALAQGSSSLPNRGGCHVALR
jgi:hypothetical protein